MILSKSKNIDILYIVWRLKICTTVKVMSRFIGLPCSYKDDVEVCCLIWRQTDQSTYGHNFSFLIVSCANKYLHYIRRPCGKRNSHTIAFACIGLFWAYE